MKFITQDELDMLAEEDIRTEGKLTESLINSAIKYHPMYFMNQYKEEIETTIFNKNFIKEVKNKK